MKCLITLVCVLTQLFLSAAVADEMPAKASPARYFKTLEGMPTPSNIPTPGTLKGFIQTSEGEPMAGADILFFNDAFGPPPMPQKYWRYFDQIAKLDDKGGFSVQLVPGKYYIGAVQRKIANSILAPPADGDIFYYENKKYEVFSGLPDNLGVITGARPYSKNIPANGDAVTAIEGKVLDAAGNPVENAIVASYNDATVNGMPLFGSDLTGKDGAYFLRVAGAGRYYLRVREVYGVGAMEGELMLAYGGSKPKGVTVKEGEVVKGIDLTGEKFLRPVNQ